MLRSLLSRFSGPKIPDPDRPDAVKAAAVLLVEAAMADGVMEIEEKEMIRAMLRVRLGLSPPEAEAYLQIALDETSHSAQLHPFASAVRQEMSYEERLELVEMLWRVAYADGVVHDYESNLVRRVCGLIYVSDQDSGAMRRKVQAEREAQR